MNRLLFLGVAITCLLSARRSHAVEYRFTNIADTNTAAPVGMFTGFQLACDEGTCRFLEPPAISGNTVAFYGQFAPRNGIFKGSGGAVTTIVKTGDPVPTGSSFSALGLRDFSISGRTVAFFGIDNSPPPNRNGIFAGSGGPLTKVVARGDPAPTGTFTASFSDASIERETVVFETLLYSVDTIFTVKNGTFTKIVARGDPAPIGTFHSVGRPDYSSGVVAFSGAFDRWRTVDNANQDWRCNTDRDVHGLWSTIIQPRHGGI
jgi:hypothetical protein